MTTLREWLVANNHADTDPQQIRERLAEPVEVPTWEKTGMNALPTDQEILAEQAAISDEPQEWTGEQVLMSVNIGPNNSSVSLRVTPVGKQGKRPIKGEGRVISSANAKNDKRFTGLLRAIEQLTK